MSIEIGLNPLQRLPVAKNPGYLGENLSADHPLFPYLISTPVDPSVDPNLGSESEKKLFRDFMYIKNLGHGIAYEDFSEPLALLSTATVNHSYQDGNTEEFIKISHSDQKDPNTLGQISVL